MATSTAIKNELSPYVPFSVKFDATGTIHHAPIYGRTLDMSVCVLVQNGA